MTRQEREAARAKFLALFAQGYSWSAAAQAADLAISRATAFRLRQRAQLRGDQAVVDQRHGHPYLVSPALRDWTHAFCQRNPAVPTRLLQAALRAEFGTTISLTHLNRLRRALGVAAPRTTRSKKV